MSSVSKEEILVKLKPIVAEQLGVDEADVKEDASFTDDLNADSLDLVEMIMSLEEQFDIKIELTPRQRRQLLSDITDLFVTHHEVAGILNRDISSSTNPLVVERVTTLLETLTVLMTRIDPTKADRVIVASILGAVLGPLTDPLIDPGDPETRAIVNRLAGIMAKQIAPATPGCEVPSTRIREQTYAESRATST